MPRSSAAGRAGVHGTCCAWAEWGYLSRYQSSRLRPFDLKMISATRTSRRPISRGRSFASTGRVWHMNKHKV